MGRHADPRLTGRHVACNDRACADGRLITDVQMPANGAVDNSGVRPDVDGFTKGDTARDLNAGHERPMGADPCVMADRAMQIEQNVLANHAIHGNRHACANDRADSNNRSGANARRWMDEGCEFESGFRRLQGQFSAITGVADSNHNLPIHEVPARHFEC